MKRLLSGLLIVAAVLASGTAFARYEPLVNHENVQVTSGTGKTLSADEMKAIIQRVAARLRWELTDLGTGKMAGSYVLSRGKHMMVVTIGYGQNSYSVTYKDSYDLNYSYDGGQPVIHPNYNKSVRTLVDMIRLETQKY